MSNYRWTNAYHTQAGWPMWNARKTSLRSLMMMTEPGILVLRLRQFFDQIDRFGKESHGISLLICPRINTKSWNRSQKNLAWKIKQLISEKMLFRLWVSSHISWWWKCWQACLSVDSLVNRRADVGIGSPAPNPECETGTLAQKQEVSTAHCYHSSTAHMHWLS